MLRLWYKRLLGCIFIMIISLLVSGCWDRRELEDRHYVLAVAIDRGDQGLGSEEKDVARVETFAQPYGTKRYRLSFQILGLMPSSSIVNGPQGEELTYIISNTGESMFEMLRDMLGQIDQPFWFEHMQVIIISEAAVRQGGLQPMIDLFRRDTEMRSTTKLIMTSGEARSLLEYQPPSGEPGGIFIANSLRLYKKNPHVPGWHTDVGDLAKSVDNKGTVLLARIELADKIIKLGGMAVFKNGKFAGYVDEYVTQGGKFVSGIEKSAIITVECPEHHGKIIAFELFRHNTKLTPHVDGEKIYYTLDIAMRGNVGETQCGLTHDLMDATVIHQIEELVAEEVKRNVLYTLHTYQELHVDASVFGAKLQAHEPATWEKVKDSWNDEIFPTITLAVSVNVVVESIGAHK